MQTMTYPTYKLTPAQVTATFEAAGLVISAEDAARYSAELIRGDLPRAFVLAQADADSECCSGVLRSNVQSLRGIVAATPHGARRDTFQTNLAEMEARLARLDARERKGLFCGPGAAKAAQRAALGV